MSNYFDMVLALKDAGFNSKLVFAKHYDVHPDTVSRWGDSPPGWVRVVLKERSAHYRALQGD